jgi:uncharacterized 2Fe-2S/4Fe-4S cluster protein (DUF4445 family)
MIQAVKSATRGISIIFDPDAVKIHTAPGKTLLDSAKANGIRIASACGGRGICKSCVVHFTGGEVPEPSNGDKQFFSAAKLAKGWRRACQVSPTAGCRIHIPARTRAASARMQVDGADFWVRPEPVVHAVEVTLDTPVLDNPVADCDRLMNAVNGIEAGACGSVDIEVMRTLPPILRQNNQCVQAVLHSAEVIAVQPVNTRLIGLAVDLGTTNIGVFLIDLHSGSTIASGGLENPQVVFGGNVISRIETAIQAPEKAQEMHRIVVDALNEYVQGLCENHHLSTAQIVDAVVAGNTAMHHLFLKLPVRGLGLAPFTATVAAAVDVKAAAIGLHSAPGAYIHMMANIAGFVGGDHTAMLMGICADQEKRTVIALDIGTNTEISLIHDNRITSLSCPSGPALEGGHITCGMRAAQGAIESVSIDEGVIKLETIGGGQPVGLCGSAVLDAVAAFYLDGGLNQRGRILENYAHTMDIDGERGFLLHAGDPEVVFTQKDVRSVQLAKGAIRAGIDLLLTHEGLEYSQLDKIIVAGAFGNYLRIESACAIGMFPALPMDRFEQVGNSAGIGAKLAVLSYPLREKAQLLARKSRYIVQAGNPRFNAIFMKSINLPDLA